MKTVFIIMIKNESLACLQICINTLIKALYLQVISEKLLVILRARVIQLYQNILVKLELNLKSINLFVKEKKVRVINILMKAIVLLKKEN